MFAIDIFDSELYLYICIPEIVKTTLSTQFFLVKNPLKNLCFRVVNSLRLFYNKKNSMKCSY